MTSPMMNKWTTDAQESRERRTRADLAKHALFCAALFANKEGGAIRDKREVTDTAITFLAWLESAAGVTK